MQEIATEVKGTEERCSDIETLAQKEERKKKALPVIHGLQIPLRIQSDLIKAAFLPSSFAPARVNFALTPTPISSSPSLSTGSYNMSLLREIWSLLYFHGCTNQPVTTWLCR